MSATGKSRTWSAGLLVILVSAALLAVAKVGPAPAAEDRWLAGRLLVAAPSMVDPRFRNVVIYVCVHDAEGAFGLVVNRPLGTVESRVLASEFGLQATGSEAPVSLLWGGPVEIGRGFVLHSTDYLSDNSVKVTDEIAMSADPTALAALLDGRGPERAFLVLGYAGWGPNQLEGELAQEDWFAVDAGAEFVFETERGQMWNAALALRTLDL